MLRKFGHGIGILKKNHGMTGFPQKTYGITGFQITVRPPPRIGKRIDKKVKVMPSTVQKCCSKVMLSISLLLWQKTLMAK